MHDYTLLNKLGTGAFSTVYKVKRKQDGEQYAMKKIRIMSLQDKEISNCLNEVRILASIESPHIVGYKDSFFDQVTNTFCIVTEFLSGGDLLHLIQQNKSQKRLIPENTIWRIAIQVISALNQLHKASILHRDIKPANVFLTGSKIAKLGDMNVSIVSSNGMAKTQTGTPYYASPQVWNQRPYNSKCDIWSLGCVLYQMAAQRPPFSGNDMRSLKKSILNGTYKGIPSAYTTQLNDLISYCLRIEPKSRLSAEELLKLDCIMKRVDVIQNKENTTLMTTKDGKLLQKIQAPRKFNFRIVKDRLPKSRFSSLQKDQTIEQDKQNLKNNSMVSQGQRSQILKKSCSSTRRRLSPMKKPLGKDTQTLEKPPLPQIPKNRILRA